MDFQIEGKIVAVLPKQTGVSKNGNPYSVQDYVVEAQDQFKQKICFNVFGEDKINQFKINLGDNVIVNFNINATLYNNKWYNHLQAWKVVKTSSSQQNTNNNNNTPTNEEQAPF